MKTKQQKREEAAARIKVKIDMMEKRPKEQRSSIWLAQLYREYDRIKSKENQ